MSAELNQGRNIFDVIIDADSSTSQSGFLIDELSVRDPDILKQKGSRIVRCPYPDSRKGGKMRIDHWARIHRNWESVKNGIVWLRQGFMETHGRTDPLNLEDTRSIAAMGNVLPVYLLNRIHNPLSSQGEIPDDVAYLFTTMSGADSGLNRKGVTGVAFEARQLYLFANGMKSFSSGEASCPARPEVVQEAYSLLINGSSDLDPTSFIGARLEVDFTQLRKLSAIYPGARLNAILWRNDFLSSRRYDSYQWGNFAEKRSRDIQESIQQNMTAIQREFNLTLLRDPNTARSISEADFLRYCG